MSRRSNSYWEAESGFAPVGDEPSERLAVTAWLRQTATFIGDINRTGKVHIVTRKRVFLTAILLGVVCGTALAQSSDPLAGLQNRKRTDECHGCEQLRAAAQDRIPQRS